MVPYRIPAVPVTINGMPNQHEYRAAARWFREKAGALKVLSQSAQQLLPATEIEGPFRGFFESSLSESHRVGQSTEGEVEAAAAECERRANVCAKYTQDMRAHLAAPGVVDKPPRPAQWADLG